MTMALDYYGHERSRRLGSEIAAEAAKASPALGVVAASQVWSVPDLVQLATLIYIVLQVSILLWKHCLYPLVRYCRRRRKLARGA